MWELAGRAEDFPLELLAVLVFAAVDLAAVDRAPGFVCADLPVDFAAVDFAADLAAVDFAPGVLAAVDLVDFRTALAALAAVCLPVVCGEASTTNAPQPAANTAAETEMARARKESV